MESDLKESEDTMNVKKNGAETFVYILICLLSLGSAFVLRLIITVAIRCALQNDGEK